MQDDRFKMTERTAALNANLPRLQGILGLVAAIGVLFVARSVLIPVTVAVLLSFLVAPLVRLIHHTGLNKAASVFAAIALPIALIVTMAGVILTQVAHLASDLPHYEETLRDKFNRLQRVTVGRVGLILGDSEKLWSQMTDDSTREDDGSADTLDNNHPALTLSNHAALAPTPVEIREPAPTALQVTRQLASSVLRPLATMGVVFVVWIFVLLDHEALRDRLIRLAGSKDLRRTTIAMNDAGARLSRYFISQLAVNAGVGLLAAGGLAVIGVPNAILLGISTMVMRFVPYVGVWIAAVLAAVLGAAIDPGWSTMVLAVLLFVSIELMVGQIIEPLLYGHTTGLSPLSVVLAAIFWGWIWGPVGLILSTPLTLCLVVLGRYVAPLNFLEILLGDAPALALHQQFYQRVLSGDAEEIIEKGRKFLKTKSFVEYCDSVVLPAVQLASSDAPVRTEAQRRRATKTVVHVIEALSGTPRARPLRAQKSALDTFDRSAGNLLRARRELLRDRSPESSDAVSGPVLLCMGLNAEFDELTTELLVRALRQLHLDGRHFSASGMGTDKPCGASKQDVATVFLVSMDLVAIREKVPSLIAQLRQKLPLVQIVSVFQPAFFIELRDLSIPADGVDYAAKSFEDAIHASLERNHLVADLG